MNGIEISDDKSVRNDNARRVLTGHSPEGNLVGVDASDAPTKNKKLQT